MTSLYFFNLVSGSDAIPDPHGIEVGNPIAALALAYEAVEEFLSEEAVASAHWWDWHLEIVDETGQEIHRISLSHYLRKKSRQRLEAGTGPCVHPAIGPAHRVANRSVLERDHTSS